MSTDTSNEAALRIARFIITELDYRGPVTDLVGDQPVRLTEAVDSVALLEVATFVEDSFCVQITDDDIVPANFGTVADLVRLLRDKGALTSFPVADGETGRRMAS
jgi:acyl carrier protein